MLPAISDTTPGPERVERRAAGLDVKLSQLSNSMLEAVLIYTADGRTQGFQ